MNNKVNYTNLTVAEFDSLRQLLAGVLGTETTPIVIPSEAMLGIEAIARGIAAPGRTILNIVTGPYGRIFGTWLERGGSKVVEIQTAFNQVVDVELVRSVIEMHKLDAISFVQAEAVTGGSNPTKEILKLASEYNLITVIDSVSAVGAEPLRMDEWGIDFVAIGAQKALSGPNGVSAVGISERGWAFLESNPHAPRQSILSLLDLKDDGNHGLGGAVPLTIPILEARALIHALELVQAEGLDALQRRHRLASAATIAGLRELGLEPWLQNSAAYAPLVTTVAIGDRPQLTIQEPVGIVAPGNGELKDQVLRINHFGQHALLESVEQALQTLAELLQADPQQAVLAAREAWQYE